MAPLLPDVSVKPTEANREAHGSGGLWTLALGSVGVVYGDIGTSPIYAFREAMLATNDGGTAVSHSAVLGILSLIFWSLILIVTLKYVIILTRADNKGEGGTLALMALAQRAFGGARGYLIFLGIVAAALFYGNSLLTPALSVLSAVEGGAIALPALHEFVILIAIVILFLLFFLQSRGTARVARLFGPITCLWFLVIAVLGIAHIIQNPAVIAAINPIHGARFLIDHGYASLLTLGAVFLAVTGGEALYADLGHFGRRPIQLAWFGLVLPALVLSYFGQGALLLRDPVAVTNPFFLLAPGWGQLPLAVLATAATAIASQAVITGTYSLTQQAIQLGLLPRLEIQHTSGTHFGQIYMPRVNTILLVGVLLLVILFQSSTALAGAYGIAVSGTMVVTAVLAILVVWKAWHWSLLAALALMLPFALIDSAFLGANLLKILSGGWFSVIVAILLMIVMLTWRRGTGILLAKTRRLEIPLVDLCNKLEADPPRRVAGTAIFLTSDPASAPTALLHSLKHFKVLHENNVVLTVMTTDTPRVDPDDRVTMDWISKSFARMTIRYGFMESPNVPKALAVARKLGWTFDIMSTSFFLSRRSVMASARSGMPLWQDRLFILLARNADDASAYFQIPTDRVVEIGTQITV